MQQLGRREHIAAIREHRHFEIAEHQPIERGRLTFDHWRSCEGRCRHETSRASAARGQKKAARDVYAASLIGRVQTAGVVCCVEQTIEDRARYLLCHGVFLSVMATRFMEFQNLGLPSATTGSLWTLRRQEPQGALGRIVIIL
jgi:hypothetical protein